MKTTNNRQLLIEYLIADSQATRRILPEAPQINRIMVIPL